MALLTAAGIFLLVGAWLLNSYTVQSQTEEERLINSINSAINDLINNSEISQKIRDLVGKPTENKSYFDDYLPPQIFNDLISHGQKAQGSFSIIFGLLNEIRQLSGNCQTDDDKKKLINKIEELNNNLSLFIGHLTNYRKVLVEASSLLGDPGFFSPFKKGFKDRLNQSASELGQRITALQKRQADLNSQVQLGNHIKLADKLCIKNGNGPPPIPPPDNDIKNEDVAECVKDFNKLAELARKILFHRTTLDQNTSTNLNFLITNLEAAGRNFPSHFSSLQSAINRLNKLLLSPSLRQVEKNALGSYLASLKQCLKVTNGEQPPPPADNEDSARIKECHKKYDRQLVDFLGKLPAYFRIQAQELKNKADSFRQAAFKDHKDRINLLADGLLSLADEIGGWIKAWGSKVPFKNTYELIDGLIAKFEYIKAYYEGIIKSFPLPPNHPQSIAMKKYYQKKIDYADTVINDLKKLKEDKRKCANC